MTRQMDFEEHVASAVRMRVEQRTPDLSPDFHANLMDALPTRPLEMPIMARGRQAFAWIAAACVGVLLVTGVWSFLAEPAVLDAMVDGGEFMLTDLLIMPDALLDFLEDLSATISPSDMIVVFLAVVTPAVMLFRHTPGTLPAGEGPPLR
jgi:hypothetical protein